METLQVVHGRGYYDICGFPHLSKVLLKPKGVGVEVKNTLCCTSCVMVLMEMLEGKAVMANTEFCCPCVNTTTETTLHLVKPWMYKGRHIMVDSWFALVQTAVMLHKHCCFFTGMIKTAHC